MENDTKEIAIIDVENDIKNLVIAIIGDKGGIGKTLVAYNLIYRILQDEPSSQLIDCDNDQFSSADFAAIRKKAGIEPNLPVVNIPTQDLEKYLLESSKKIRISIIEFGKSFGEDEESRKKALELAVKLADIVLCPMQASPVDALAFGKFEEKLPPEIANIPALLIPNRVKTKARLKLVLDSTPDLKYFKISKSFLGDRLCYQDHFRHDGRTIFEIKGKSDSEKEAKIESENLYQEIINLLAKSYEK